MRPHNDSQSSRYHDWLDWPEPELQPDRRSHTAYQPINVVAVANTTATPPSQLYSGSSITATYTLPMAPTPESAAFLAKKPTVAPTFDGVDYDDTPRLKQAQDAIIREQWVRSMMARLVREEMGKCYYREGVNHLEKCGPLRGMRLSGARGSI